MTIITLVERSKIELMHNQQCPIQTMATTSGRSRLSIRCEIPLCAGGYYSAIAAQKHADICRYRCGRHSILTSRLNRVITG